MIWHDYLRGFADGQQDRNGMQSPGFNPVLILFRLIRVILFFVLTVCYAVLKALTLIVGIMIWMVVPKRR